MPEAFFFKLGKKTFSLDKNFAYHKVITFETHIMLDK